MQFSETRFAQRGESDPFRYCSIYHIEHKVSLTPSL